MVGSGLKRRYFGTRFHLNESSPFLFQRDQPAGWGFEHQRCGCHRGAAQTTAFMNPDRGAVRTQSLEEDELDLNYITNGGSGEAADVGLGESKHDGSGCSRGKVTGSRVQTWCLFIADFSLSLCPLMHHVPHYRDVGQGQIIRVVTYPVRRSRTVGLSGG